MDLSQRVRAILSFVEAANAGSFAAAARLLGISAAAVSKNVASLEKALAVRLMNRTTRTLNLTDEGAAFLRQAKIALEALDMAVDAVVAQKAETSGHVRISTSAAFGRDQLVPAIPGLLSRYPALSVEVDFDDRVVDFVQGGYDLAIRGGRIIDSALISRHVCHLNMILVASPHYLEKTGVPKIPQELKLHKLVARRFLGGKVSPWSFKKNDGSIIAIDPDPAVLTLSAPESLVQAASLGLGIAQVGVHHAIKHLMAGSLKVVLLGQHDPGSYEMVMQYPHRALIAPRVRVTIDCLLEAFAQDKSLHVPLNELSAYSSTVEHP